MPTSTPAATVTFLYICVTTTGADDPGRAGSGGACRLSPQSVWGVVKKYAALAGVEATTHHLRHLKARTLLNNGAQLSEVQDLLGHASPETTKRIYAQYTTQRLREAFDRFSRSPEAVATGVTSTRRRGGAADRS